MPPAPATADRPALPTRWKAALFLVKARGLQAARVLRNAGRGRVRRFATAPAASEGRRMAESVTELYPSSTPEEFALQAGKVQNLRIAAGYLDGVIIPRGEIFSFWAHVPRPTRRRGFAPGRELREGCIIPSIGGGLCQLSNALYDVALRAGCQIVERHGHSQRVPGSMAEVDRDATVFWNYVDLRFRPPADCRLEIHLTRGELLVRLCALCAVDTASLPATPAILRGNNPAASQPAESCETCGMTDCFRHSGLKEPGRGMTAWLVDGWWPEFDIYMQQNRKPGDWLFLPIRGGRFRNYRWETRGFAQTRQAAVETLRRSWASRRLAAQGAERQRTLLLFDQHLANRYLRRLPATALHLVVSQALLPHLWRAGALGGRTFDVLMTRLPLASLQAALDRAAACHPGSPTLTDFRAPPDLVSAETAALAEARHWITPHSTIARLGGPRAVKLSWQIPHRSAAPVQGLPMATDVLFPASTLARKGAYELACAARRLGLRVQLGGALLEGAGCWDGVNTAPADANLTRVGAVVLPAWVEHQPRRLLEAVAAGVPVIAGDGCGLEAVPGVITVREGDIAMLTETLAAVMQAGQPAYPA